MNTQSINVTHLVEVFQSLVDLLLECRRRLDQVKQLSVVHLEQHTRDLSGKVRLSATKVSKSSERVLSDLLMDKRVESLS